MHNLSTGDRERKHTQPDNTASTTLGKTDGTTVTTEADGTLTTLVKGHDPRFSMLSPIIKSLQTSTGGLTTNLTGQRTAVLSDTNNPLSLTKLTESVTLNGRTQTTVYDAASKTFTTTSPAVRQTKAVIDSLDRITQSQTTGLLSVNNTYDLHGFGEVTGYLAKYATADLYKTDVSRDKLGLITQKTETVGGSTRTFDYAYDVAGRLVEVKQNGIVQSSYGYDENGNRTDLNGTPIAHYDAQDRLLDYNSATYDYTANGELKTKTVGNATTSYHYDVLGNLRQVTLPTSGTAIDYVIDGQNRRIGKKRNNVLEQGFLYQDQLKPIAELDGNNAIVSRFVYATGANVPDFMIKGGATYRLIKDHLGSPRLVVDIATNTVIQQMSYDVWGKVIQDSNPGFQPFGFAGGLYDRDTHLVRFGARDYDAETGRWTAKDPIQFKGGDTNLYGYVLNDPINSIDSLGLVNGTSPGTINYVGIPQIYHALSRLAEAQGDNFYTDEYYVLERAMLGRLTAGFADSEDIAFYHHEMAEALICEKYSNLPNDQYLEVQNEAHKRVLDTQGNTSNDLYHPTVKSKYPDFFR